MSSTVEIRNNFLEQLRHTLALFEKHNDVILEMLRIIDPIDWHRCIDYIKIFKNDERCLAIMYYIFENGKIKKESIEKGCDGETMTSIVSTVSDEYKIDMLKLLIPYLKKLMWNDCFDLLALFKNPKLDKVFQILKQSGKIS